MSIFLSVLSTVLELIFTIGFGLLPFGGFLLLLDKNSQSKASCIQGVIVGRCFDANKYNSSTNNAGIDVLLEKGKTNKCYPIFMYYVNGVEYRRAGVVRRDINELEQDISQHKKVDVYYNPDVPEQSWISKQGPLAVLGRKVLCLGVILLALGAVSIFFIFKNY
ncbi:MAG: hypothetical protein UIM53_04290 [Acutalibacteraceae bacterium]|nr:hypothetical protein [Acutalibacteraceae bacterium]